MKAEYITPAVTVFDKEGNLDHDGLKNLYDHLIRGGVSGILILGSIGEFFAIPFERKKELIRLAVRHIAGKIPLLVGTGGMDANETVELSRYAIGQGADGVMVISPFYFSLSDKSVEEYYDHVAGNCPGKLYLYNFPERTGYDLSPRVALNLLRKHDNIAGYKDTLSGMDHTRELIRLTKGEFPNFKVWSGFDDNFARNVLSGGDGCVAGLSNLAPELCGAWVKAFEEGDMDRVSEIQEKIDILMGIYQVGKPFVPYIKKAMILRGIPIRDYCSFPLPRVTEPEAAELKRIMKRAGLA